MCSILLASNFDFAFQPAGMQEQKVFHIAKAVMDYQRASCMEVRRKGQSRDELVREFRVESRCDAWRVRVDVC